MAIAAIELADLKADTDPDDAIWYLTCAVEAIAGIEEHAPTLAEAVRKGDLIVATERGSAQRVAWAEALESVPDRESPPVWRKSQDLRSGW